MPGNDWGNGACPSILFKALRMELNGLFLQACGIRSNWNAGMLEYWNAGRLDYEGNYYTPKSYWLSV